MEDKIIEAIVTDEELFLYIERLVRKRLPQGPKLKSEVMWYKQVVDYSINQAFEDLQIVDILNYQISQLGKYLKKKQQQERQQLNEESPEDVHVIEQNDRDEAIQSNNRQTSHSFTSQIGDDSMLLSDAHGDESCHHIRQPQYSDSEPTLQTAGSRRRKGSSSNSSTTTASPTSSSSRTPSIIPSSQSTTTTPPPPPLSNHTSAVIDMTSTTTANRIHNDNVEEGEDNEEIENAKLQRALEIAKRYNIISDPPEVVAFVPSTTLSGGTSSDGRVTNVLTMMDVDNESPTILFSPSPSLPVQQTVASEAAGGGSFSPVSSPVISTTGSPDRSSGGVVDLGTCRIPSLSILYLKYHHLLYIPSPLYTITFCTIPSPEISSLVLLYHHP